MTQETQQSIEELKQASPKYTFELTIEECNYIFAGLGELPTKIGKPLMDNMQLQFAKQTNKAAE